MSLWIPSPRSAVGIVLATVQQLVANRVLTMSAALAYYSALSLAPLVIITFGVTGLIVDRSVVEEQLIRRAEELLGHDAGGLLRTLVTEQQLSGAGSWAAAAGAAMLVFAASAVFVQLQDGLNLIWGVRPGPRQSVLLYFRTRLISMALVFCLGAVLLASVLAGAFVSAMGNDLDELLGASTRLALVIQLGSSFALTTSLFALLFKWLPQAHVSWLQAWAGALLSAGLFHLGAWAIGQYVAHAAVGSAYGAAGSIVILLVWVYYAGFIVFTGAQFARVLALNAPRPSLPAPRGT